MSSRKKVHPKWLTARRRIQLTILGAVLMGIVLYYLLGRFFLQASVIGTIINNFTVSYCTESEPTASCDATKNIFSGTVTSNSVQTNVEGEDVPDPTPPTSQTLKLKVNLYGRTQSQQDNSTIKLEITDVSTNAVVSTLTTASDANGMITITDTKVTNLVSDALSYNIKTKARGFISRSLKTKGLLSETISLPLAPVGDFDENGKVDLVDLAKASAVYSGKNAPTPVFQEVYKYNPTPGVPTLVDLARLVSNGYKTVDQ